jgi:acyl dehydratase
MKQAVYGADVEPGDEIGPLVKRPDLAQVQAYLSSGMRAGGGQGGRFVDAEAASREGLGGPILPGPMSQAFLAQLLTDWAGPLGRLKSLDVNFRRPTLHGEELKCIGLITDKHEEMDRTVVHIDVFIEDPRGDRPTQGVAEVILPTHP